MTGRGRYEGVEVATVLARDGTGGDREVAFLLARSPSSPANMLALSWHRVGPEDRIDLVTARYLGDPAAFWRVCDANLALDPAALVGPAAEGSIIVIPVPGV